MPPSSNEILRHLFDMAMAVPPADRSALLDRACADDTDLKRRIEAMIAGAEDDRFLGSPTSEIAPPISLSSGAASDSSAGVTPGTALLEGPGTRIGPYKILQAIGEGGFGTVFMAEQESPVNRKVALKIIKLGMDTRQVIARFEAERQALAMMDHPSIARVFDAGTTATGRPYFAMELCKGDPITTYCDKRNLPINQRLELFGQVCNAAQHAHTKGIIHRDIKPSNILVSVLDGRPNIKVIDFGIAKATSARLTERTLFTEHQSLIGTPEYMSPEQAEGSLDIDTRSDIYSLGVLLYELLTGTTPFSKSGLHSAAYAEIQRIIREVTPPKPSVRLSQDTRSLKGVAAMRDTPPERLGSLIRNDLDWIVMKALEKDRQRRYDTASALALDVQRFLAGEPVLAAPPSAAYRARKFVRRHRTAVIAGGTVAASLVLAIVGTSAGLIWALKEKTRADAETARATDATRAQTQAKEAAQKSEQQAHAARDEEKQARTRAEATATFVTKALLAGDPRSGGKLDATIAQAMQNAIKDLDAGAFKDDPRTESSLRNTIATILLNNGHYAEAEPLFLRAIELREQALGPDHPDVASALNNLANLYLTRGQYREAEPVVVRGLAIRERTLGPDHIDVARSLMNLAGLYRILGRYQDAEPLFDRALSIREKKLGPVHPDVASTLAALGGLYADSGDFPRSEPLITRALAIREETLSPDHPDLTQNLHSLAVVCHGLNQYERAEPLFARALELRERALGPSHPAVSATLTSLGGLYCDQRRFDAAEPILLRALEIREKALGPDHPEYAATLSTLARAQHGLGHEPDSRTNFERAIAIHRQRTPDGSPLLAQTLWYAGSAAFDPPPSEPNPAGLAQLQQAVAVAEKVLAPSHPSLAKYRRTLAQTLEKFPTAGTVPGER